MDDVLLVCATETTTDDDIAAFAEAAEPGARPMSLARRRPAHPPRTDRRAAAGHRDGHGLVQDEPLIFELGGWDKTGVDLPTRPRRSTPRTSPA